MGAATQAKCLQRRGSDFFTGGDRKSVYIATMRLVMYLYICHIYRESAHMVH